MNSLAVLDALASGKKPRRIAVETGCAYSTMRRRIARMVHALGCKTPEQAVAAHVVKSIGAYLPLALRVPVARFARARWAHG